MFTGLVEDLGTISAVETTADGARLRVRTPLAEQLAEGDSIAVNGVCLTAVALEPGSFAADAMHETLRRSSLAAVAPGDPVNLELALRADARLGGHIMQGHVDGVGEIAGVREDGFARVVTIAAPADLLRYVVEKGSIAVDGVSLTVVARGRGGLRRVAHPRDARAHDARRRRAGEPGEPRGGHRREVRGEDAVPPAAGRSRSPVMTQETREAIVFSTVEEALEDIAAGKMIVVVDDEDRENEGDLVMAAEHVTPDAINFMATYARGWICLALTGQRCDELGLELMTAKNDTPFETPFTVTIEAREGVTTGISAADRAHTIRTAVDPANGPEAIVKGGHVNPLKAKPGGVLERTGHTEASVDLARLAGCVPAGVICEVMNEDGSMARVGDLQAYCFKHGLRMITIADLIAYRRRHDKLVERVVATSMPTAFGDFTVVGYRSLVDDKHHVAMVKGDVDGQAGRARARALRVPDRRRLPLAALRLRRAARGGARADRRGRRGRAALPRRRRAAASAC